jgi:hypothetical protein
MLPGIPAASECITLRRKSCDVYSYSACVLFP